MSKQRKLYLRSWYGIRIRTAKFLHKENLFSLGHQQCVIGHKKKLETSPGLFTQLLPMQHHSRCSGPWEVGPVIIGSSPSSGQLPATIQKCCSWMLINQTQARGSIKYLSHCYTDIFTIIFYPPIFPKSAFYSLQEGCNFGIHSYSNWVDIHWQA